MELTICLRAENAFYIKTAGTSKKMKIYKELGECLLPNSPIRCITLEKVKLFLHHRILASGG